jgi:hypothetical protein
MPELTPTPGYIATFFAGKTNSKRTNPVLQVLDVLENQNSNEFFVSDGKHYICGM